MNEKRLQIHLSNKHPQNGLVQAGCLAVHPENGRSMAVLTDSNDSVNFRVPPASDFFKAPARFTERILPHDPRSCGSPLSYRCSNPRPQNRYVPSQVWQIKGDLVSLCPQPQNVPQFQNICCSERNANTLTSGPSLRRSQLEGDKVVPALLGKCKSQITLSSNRTFLGWPSTDATPKNLVLDLKDGLLFLYHPSTSPVDEVPSPPPIFPNFRRHGRLTNAKSGEPSWSYHFICLCLGGLGGSPLPWEHT
jgi:hypothetical protein